MPKVHAVEVADGDPCAVKSAQGVNGMYNLHYANRLPDNELFDPQMSRSKISL